MSQGDGYSSDEAAVARGAGAGRVASQREQETWDRLLAFHTGAVDAIERVLGDRFGLSLSEYITLSALAKASGEEGLRMRTLTDAVGLNQSSISRLVSRLEDQRLVQRTAFSRDRRGVFTRITAEGRAQLELMRSVYLHTLAAAFDKAMLDPELREFIGRIA